MLEDICLFDFLFLRKTNKLNQQSSYLDWFYLSTDWKANSKIETQTKCLK